MFNTAIMINDADSPEVPVRLLENFEPIKFPVPSPHFAYVRKLRRNSGLTSVRWFDKDTLFIGDFAAKSVYLVKPYADTPVIKKISTPDGHGVPTETDLMDIRANSMVLTNFYTGEVAFYDVGPDCLSFSHTIMPPSKLNKQKGLLSKLFGKSKDKPIKGRKIHGAVFVPGYENLLWSSFCDSRDKGVEITKLDGSQVHSLPLPEQAQDVAFIECYGETYAIQAARTDHISVKAPNEKSIYVTMFVYRLPSDLEKTPPELILTRYFSGHVDAIKAYKGAVYAANQHDSCVDEFFYDPLQNELTLNRRFTGFDMPHGLDVSPDGKVAVTNYGPDNDLRIFQLDR